MSSRRQVASEVESQAYGFAVSSAGDVDGDGVPSLAVGNNPYTYDSDHAWVDQIKLSQPVGSSGFGCVLASAGDVDLDGYADLLVGAGGYLCLGLDQGSVGARLYRGSPEGLAEAWDLSTGSEMATTALRGLGDVDGDGDDDVAVGLGWDDTVTIHLGEPSDADGDGAESGAWAGDDCDDSDPERFPGAVDLPGDGVDQDCDGVDASEDSDSSASTLEPGDKACGCGGAGAPALSGLLTAILLVSSRRRLLAREDDEGKDLSRQAGTPFGSGASLGQAKGGPGSGHPANV